MIQYRWLALLRILSKRLQLHAPAACWACVTAVALGLPAPAPVTTEPGWFAALYEWL